MTDEDVIALRRRSAAEQVSGDRTTHTRRQRQAVPATDLADLHAQGSSTPVDVVEPQPGDFTGTKTQCDEALDDGMRPQPDRGPDVDRPPKLLELLLG